MRAALYGPRHRRKRDAKLTQCVDLFQITGECARVKGGSDICDCDHESPSTFRSTDISRLRRSTGLSWTQARFSFAWQPAASAVATCMVTTGPLVVEFHPSSWATKPRAGIAAVGAGVRGLSEGDRVTFDSTVYCGACSTAFAAKSICATGDKCWAFPVRNTGAPELSPSMLTVPPARIVYPLPDNFAFADAAMLEAVGRRHAPLFRWQKFLLAARHLSLGRRGTIGLLIVQALVVADAPGLRNRHRFIHG